MSGDARRPTPGPGADAATPCPGCRAVVRHADIDPHPYIGASPGCWHVYTQVLAKEYGEYNYPDVHRLTVDTYAAQHPGAPSRRSTQSVATHLIALHTILDLDLTPRAATAAIRRAVSTNPQRFHWLEPPPTLGPITILDIAAAATLPDHEAAVHRWARAVWHAWTPHHATIRAWAAGR